MGQQPGRAAGQACGIVLGTGLDQQAWVPEAGAAQPLVEGVGRHVLHTHGVRLCLWTMPCCRMFFPGGQKGCVLCGSVLLLAVAESSMAGLVSAFPLNGIAWAVKRCSVIFGYAAWGCVGWIQGCHVLLNPTSRSLVESTCTTR